VEVDALVSRLKADDLVVITTTGTARFFRSSLGHIPEELAAETDSSMVVIHYPG
jgi:nucleotide-binding universal stress UspA family protein